MLKKRRNFRMAALSLIGGACALLGAAAAQAHHSFAMFDRTKPLILQGTLTELQWTNPHVYIEVDVRRPKGPTVHYSLECTSINLLKRLGWKRTDLKPGDKIKIRYFPLRDGRPGGLMDAVTLPDGRTLGNGNEEAG